MKESMNVGLYVYCGVHDGEQAGFNNCSLLCSIEFSPQCSVPGLGNLGQCSHRQVGEWTRIAAYQSLTHKQTAFFLHI